MARPKGSTNKPKTPPAEAKAGPGHNSEMTEDDRGRLFFQWKKKWETALAAKKKADADLKNCAKGARSDLGPDAVLSIKDAILLQTEDGEAKMRAAINRQMQVARWMAVPLGSQGDMFGEPDRTPSVDRAYAAGKASGLAAETLNNPHAHDLPQHEHFDRGWRDGQAVNGAGIKAPEDKDLRPPFLQREDQALADVPATAFE